MPTYRFTTPTILENPGGEYHPLFSRIKIPVGITVLKIDGNYYETRYPSEDEMLDADIAYLGGITYTVDAAEKTSLESAGYEVDTIG